jgi:BlaI family penicillinase repressor
MKRQPSFLREVESEMTRIKLSEANFEIMKVIWEHGEASVPEIHSAVQAARKSYIKRESIQVQVKRLAKYGWLKRRKQGKIYFYSALAGQEEASRDIVTDVKDRIFDGSQVDMVKCLIENTAITKGELARIRSLLKDFEKTRK